MLGLLGGMDGMGWKMADLDNVDVEIEFPSYLLEL